MNESAKTKPKKLHWQAFISFTLTLSCCVMIASGVVLYLAPPGGLARMTGWQFWGLGKDGWVAQHMTSSTVFLLAGLFHLYLNMRTLWSYIRSKTIRGIRRKWELLASLILAAFMVLGTLWTLPPWNYILDGSKHLEAYQHEAASPHKGQGHHKRIRKANNSAFNEALPH
ncbi:MAG: DUF4405 domain-containing protein [Phycisphaerales bacterium]|nr:DUF4405 domain-containing protein [Phycisphaerales bacterium]